MSDDFYRAFEDEFRGARELIVERLQVYLPFIAPLRDHQPQSRHESRPRAIDLGCGRGEWLELIAAQGFDALGIDLDDGMLAACRERGLNVRTGDAIECLRALPDASQSLISGFHIAEHLPFEQLRQLMAEAERVLHPGGLLILETPNPENLVIGTSAFYLDPTHRQPLPPPLLEFLARHTGFARTQILRLNAAVALGDNPPLTLMNVLGDVSPDYAVVAQKAGHTALEEALHPTFERAYGHGLERMAAAYQGQWEQRFGAVEQRLAELAAQLAQAQSEAEARTAELQLVYASRSWRITRPLRWGQSRWRDARELGVGGTLKAIGAWLGRRGR